jgi:hypothetical protein
MVQLGSGGMRSSIYPIAAWNGISEDRRLILHRGSNATGPYIGLEVKAPGTAGTDVSLSIGLDVEDSVQLANAILAVFK